VICAVLCGALLAAGCQPLEDPVGPGAGGGDPAAARQRLDGLSVGAWGSMARYSRDRFPHWSRHDDGCNTRDLVLRREGSGVVTGDDCAITAGTWTSAYDGRAISDPQDLDIDHMVPLANAWRTGAADWSEKRREEFANDLDSPELLAVTSTTNRSKGDQDPSQWRPPRRQYWCAYAQRWIAVKSVWRLRVTSDEKDALLDMLDTC
jgi:hypothetical protein